MGERILLKGGRVLNGKLDAEADILIGNDRIEGIFPDNSCSCEEANVIDISGLTAVPGFVDLHVHFREPGFTSKETILTGSMAAARGGYTTVCAMPNLDPVPDSPETLALETEAIRRSILENETGGIAAGVEIADVRPYASITRGRKGNELVDMAALKNSCIAFSDDGSGVQNAQMMEQAMRAAAREDCIIAAHCEDNSLLKGGYIHDGTYAATHGHRGICSESEWGQIERDLEIAARTGCRYHVCHISTRESVELIRNAKAAGVRVTCETAPHYLALCEDDLQEDGRFKMNPPLRSADDREALIKGLIDGTIDAIATDHAPHTAEQKALGLERSAMGIVGLETAFPVLYTTLVRSGLVSLQRLIEALSTTPRSIFRIGGGLDTGQKADITVLDLDTPFTIDSSTFLSKGRSTPFDGWSVIGHPIITIHNGNVVYDGQPGTKKDNNKTI